MSADLRVTGRHQSSPPTGVLVDRSGTIDSANVSQQLMDANAERAYWFIQNLHTTAVMWINYDTDAVVGQPSVRVGPLEMYTPSFIARGVINVLSDTAGATFTSKEG